MGSSLSHQCHHEKITLLKSTEIGSMFLGTWLHCIETNQCENCGEIWREDVHKDRFTGSPWSSTKIDPHTCQHPHFTVDEKTITRVNKNQHLGDEILSLTFLLFFHKNVTGACYEAEAECICCGQILKAAAPISQKYENKLSTDVPGEWKLMYTTKPDPKYTIKEFVKPQKKK